MTFRTIVISEDGHMTGLEKQNEYAAFTPSIAKLWLNRFADLPRSTMYVKPVVASSSDLNHMSTHGKYLLHCNSRPSHILYSYAGALGCAMAHHAAWKIGAKHGGDILVLENNAHIHEVEKLNDFYALFKEKSMDYFSLHTLGPFEDICINDTESIVSFKYLDNVIYRMERPWMSLKCYFLSARFLKHLVQKFDLLWKMHEVPPVHVDAFVSLECIQKSFTGYVRKSARKITAGYDNDDRFIGALSKKRGTGIPHTGLLCPHNASILFKPDDLF